MSFRDGQLYMLYRDAKLVQFRIGFWHEIDKPCIQTAGSYGFKLLQTRRWLKLQFRIGLLLSESPERIWNNAAPRRIFCEPDAQRPRKTASHSGGAPARLVYLLEDAPRILQEQLASRTQLHAARQAVEKFEAQFILQIMNLAG
jgi:hypothetical protein